MEQIHTYINNFINFLTVWKVLIVAIQSTAIILIYKFFRSSYRLTKSRHMTIDIMDSITGKVTVINIDIISGKISEEMSQVEYGIGGWGYEFYTRKIDGKVYSRAIFPEKISIEITSKLEAFEHYSVIHLMSTCWLPVNDKLSDIIGKIISNDKCAYSFDTVYDEEKFNEISKLLPDNIRQDVIDMIKRIK